MSVITIAWNDLDGLKRTVESVRAQTWTSVEHIVVDGGSNDGSREWLDTLDDRTDWMSELDKGRYDAMNKGIAKASGELIWFLNSGDWFRDPDTVARVVDEYLDSDFEWAYGFSNIVAVVGRRDRRSDSFRGASIPPRRPGRASPGRRVQQEGRGSDRPLRHHVRTRRRPAVHRARGTRVATAYDRSRAVQLRRDGSGFDSWRVASLQGYGSYTRGDRRGALPVANLRSCVSLTLWAATVGQRKITRARPTVRTEAGARVSSVDVIIPAYNSVATIAAAVASALSIPDARAIVVDDGSSDETAGFAQRAGAIVIRQPNGGASKARARGLLEGDSDYVMFLDADDEIIAGGALVSVELLESDDTLSPWPRVASSVSDRVVTANYCRVTSTR